MIKILWPGSGRRVFIKQCVVLVLVPSHLDKFKYYTVFSQNAKNGAALIDTLEPRTISDQYAMNAQ